ncbi:MAG: response regulator [Candidatus Aminicenantes bacterium]|nr:response regulator [Candidatus Aminicenantes bacterium]
MIRVLVIDDEISVCQSLVGFLEDSDFDVSSACSGEEALDIITREFFDVAIVDLRLPGMSGEALVLQVYEKVPDLRFLVHTGSVDYRLSEELKGIGISQDDVFLKPMDDLNVLVARIHNVIQEKK